MRIVFIGSVDSSLLALRRCLDLGADVRGVLTRAASPVNSDFADLAPLCRERGVPVLHEKDVNSPGALEWIRACEPDVIFCFGWSNLLRSEILNLAPLGVVGYHPSLLPANRGRHPLIWALALGLERTGSTFFFMDEGADSGDILSQHEIPIRYEDDAASLYKRMTETMAEQIGEFLPALESGEYPRVPQDHALANTWRKRGRADGRIDFRMDSRAVYNLVRALARPYPGAHVETDGGDVRVWAVRELEAGAANDEPGRILSVDDGRAVVKCGRGAVQLVEHEFGQGALKPGGYL